MMMKACVIMTMSDSDKKYDDHDNWLTREASLFGPTGPRWTSVKHEGVAHWQIPENNKIETISLKLLVYI